MKAPEHFNFFTSSFILIAHTIHVLTFPFLPIRHSLPFFSAICSFHRYYLLTLFEVDLHHLNKYASQKCRSRDEYTPFYKQLFYKFCLSYNQF